MDEILRFGGREYWMMFTLLFFSRGMDFLSTWAATPNLVLEGNPIAKWMGWKLGSLLNICLVFLLSFWPMTAIIISTTSLLVASRNLQSAWLMRSMGEENYRFWYVERLQSTPISLYLACLIGQTGLVALVGGGLMIASGNLLIPFAIGLGLVAYAVTVLVYTTLALYRIRRRA